MNEKLIIDKNFSEIKINEEILIKKLKRAEEQIKNGEVTEAGVVFKRMREKYGY